MCRRHHPAGLGPSALLITLVAAICSAAVEAQILYVDDDAPPGGDGLSWDTPFKCLQDALYTAAGDPSVTEIRVAQGTYKPDQDEAGNVTPGDREATFQLVGGLALTGGYAGITEPDPDERDIDLYETILSGDLAGNDGPDFENYDENSYHVLTAVGTDVVALDGIVTTAGNADGEGEHHLGAGLFCHTSELMLVDCTVTANRAHKLCAFPSGAGLYVRDGTAYFTNCVITENRAGYGGGVHGVSADLAFDGCELSGNHAGWGGAVLAESCDSVVLTNCAFTGNSATNVGAGAFVRFTTNVSASNCEFAGNYCTDHPIPWGAGMAVRESRGTIQNCTFRENWTCVNQPWGPLHYASSAGLSVKGDVAVTNCLFIGNSSTSEVEIAEASGGAASFGDQTKVYNCTFIGNHTNNMVGPTSAGGAVLFLGSATLTNCVFIGNVAEGDTGTGGAAYVLEGVPTLTNCTFTANTASECGGVWATSDTRLTNCIAWGNSDDGGTDESAQVFGAPIVNYCCIEGWTGELGGTGNIGGDPLFVDPDGPDDIYGTEDDDVRLLPGSPCIDAGCNGALPRDWADLDEDGDTREITPLDLDGEGRFFDDPNTPDTGCRCPPIVDMGAYEFGDTGLQPCPGDLDCDRVVGHSDLGTLLGAWHNSAEGDLNCDGLTDHADLGILLTNWGAVCP
ncbi:MAG TPA: right-handed parallel beta-helix repeat-containing protein [Phycisphaerae bacterium]|nr:right-handed parallel beta-helix repeat-containing protein [Phycisphaerae bacterium]